MENPSTPSRAGCSGSLPSRVQQHAAQGSALVTKDDAHVLGSLDHAVIFRHQLRHAGDVRQIVVGDFVALERHGHAEHAVTDELRRMHAKLGGQHTVVGIGAAAALDMAGHDVAGLHAHQLAQLLGHISAGREVLGSTLGLALLLLHLGFFLAHSAFGNSHDAECLLALGAAFLYALVVLINKRFIRDVSSLDTTIMQLGFASIAILPYTLLTENIFAYRFTFTDGLLLILLGVVHTGIAYLLYFAAVKNLKGQTVAIVSYLDPTVAVVLSFITEKSFSPILLIGAIIIILSAVLSEILGDKRLIKKQNNE